MKRTALILGAGAMLGLAACSDNDEQKARTAVDSRVAQMGLMETWTGECRNISLDLFGLAAEREQYVVTTDVRKVTTFYGKNDCTEEAVRVVESGTYGNVEKVTDTDSKIDMTWKTVGIEPLSDSGKDLLNTVSFCGFSDWAKNAEKDVTPKSSDQPLIDRCWTKTPRDQFDLVRVSDGKMFLGATSGTNDKTTVEKRPTAIDDSVPYGK